MSSYRHKSGAQKRQEKKQREQEVKKASRTLFDVGAYKGEKDKKSFIETGESSCQNVSVEKEDIEDLAIPTRHDIKEREAESTTASSLNQDVLPDQSESSISELDTAYGGSCSFDVGTLARFPAMKELEKIVSTGHLPHPREFPKDCEGHKFPTTVLSVKQQNGEIGRRSWLVFSPTKTALYCLPCRLFGHTIENASQSRLVSPDGWGPNDSCWKRLWERLPEHERGNPHKKCYLAWRELERRLETDAGVESLIEKGILSEAERWKMLLERILDVVIFLGERGLAFRGDSERIGDTQNGNFLGILELLARYDPLLQEHVTKVKVAQEKGTRLQVHYLSPESQNEFISICAAHVRNHILEERRIAKYFAIMVDGTPDASHTEQTTFILRYLTKDGKSFAVQERFLAFVDCCKKSGLEIANLILETLDKYGIPIADCRGQGYDNAANMSGKYNGAQQRVNTVNPLCLYSPCACHSLNLCGADSATSCTEAVTFFGMVQTVYNLFSCSPQRWKILRSQIGSSLHGLSGTRWTDRIASVRPFAAHLPGIKKALEELLSLNLTPKTTIEVNGAIKYVSSFRCIVMSALWLKILLPIDQRNQVIQARKATIDVEVSNLRSLIDELKELRSKWHLILHESKVVANSLNILADFPAKRKSKRKEAEECEDEGDDVESKEVRAFKRDVFYVIIDSVISGLTTRFDAANNIYNTFSFLWEYLTMSEEDILHACDIFANRYNEDICLDGLKEELFHIRSIHVANFGEKSLNPLQLLNEINKFKLDEIFYNVCTALRIFCTLPVTVASAERSFSKLKLIKNFLRSTMSQQRLTDLAVLSIESEIARKIDFQTVIKDFALKKARKAFC